MGPGRIGVLASIVVLLQQPQQLPRPQFETGVEIVAVDVHVVDRSGNPIGDLKAADFEVRIDGKVRKVQSAQLVRYGAGTAVEAGVSRPGSGESPTPVAAGAHVPTPRRMFIIAVDEHSLHAANAAAAVTAAGNFIDRLQPEDLVGLYAYPTGTAQHDLTDDHASVRETLGKITGLFEEPSGRFNMTPSEIIDVSSGDNEARARVFARECRGGSMPGCTPRDIATEATALVSFMEMKVSQSVGGLRGLVRGLADIPGRKTLVLVSGGLVTTDRSGGRANEGALISALGLDAARANVSVFALHLDWSFITAQASRGGVRTSYFRDSNMATSGLERIAGTAGGTVMRVLGTSPDAAFDRVLRETSAHYLLGVEGGAEYRDGQPHTIRVSVKRRGAQVRSRTQLVIPGEQ